MAVMHGNQERVIPGNAVAVDAEKPFHALNRYGAAFLSKFEAAELPAPLLQYISYLSLVESLLILADISHNVTIEVSSIHLVCYQARSSESDAVMTL